METLNTGVIKMKMTKSTKSINGWLVSVTEVLTNIFVFAVVCGLLFNDPFGVVGRISTLITTVGDNGMAGLISLLLILLWYRR